MKGESMVNKVIDFISIKQQKENDELEKMFRKANSRKDINELDRLVDRKFLMVNDHHLFLAFLKHLENENLEAKEIFQQVLQLPKHQFEAMYGMNWFSVVQLCFTFLAILKENDHELYVEFLQMEHTE